MKYKYKILLLLAPAVFLLDQFTKQLVLNHIGFGDAIPVIPGWFDLVHVRNTGAAFGMFASWGGDFRNPFFYGISAVAILILASFFRKLDTADRFYPYPLSLIAGGVLGNLADRIRFGNVVDFLSFHVQDKAVWGIALEWPSFNVADSAITVSMILLAVHFLRNGGDKK